MKKILLIVALAGTVLAGCSKSGSDSKMRLILASELISLDEAKTLLENNSTTNNGDPRQTMYHHWVGYQLTGNYFFGIQLWQEALYNKSDWASYLPDMENVYASQPAKYPKSTISGSNAYLQNGSEVIGAEWGQWLLHVFYNGYYMIIDIQNTNTTTVDDAARTVKKKAILNSAANVALTNLKRILDNE